MTSNTSTWIESWNIIWDNMWEKIPKAYMEEKETEENKLSKNEDGDN